MKLHEVQTYAFDEMFPDYTEYRWPKKAGEEPEWVKEVLKDYEKETGQKLGDGTGSTAALEQQFFDFYGIVPLVLSGSVVKSMHKGWHDVSTAKWKEAEAHPRDREEKVVEKPESDFAPDEGPSLPASENLFAKFAPHMYQAAALLLEKWHSKLIKDLRFCVGCELRHATNSKDEILRMIGKLPEDPSIAAYDEYRLQKKHKKEHPPIEWPEGEESTAEFPEGDLGGTIEMKPTHESVNEAEAGDDYISDKEAALIAKAWTYGGAGEDTPEEPPEPLPAEMQVPEEPEAPEKSTDEIEAALAAAAEADAEELAKEHEQPEVKTGDNPYIKWFKIYWQKLGKLSGSEHQAATAKPRADIVAQPSGEGNYHDYWMAAYQAEKATGVSTFSVGSWAFEHLNWSGGFGGEAWKNISNAGLLLETTKNADDIQRIHAVDNAFDQVHNNGMAFTKIKEYMASGGDSWFMHCLNTKYIARSPLEFMDKMSMGAQTLIKYWNFLGRNDVLPTGAIYSPEETDAKGHTVKQYTYFLLLDLKQLEEAAQAVSSLNQQLKGEPINLVMAERSVTATTSVKESEARKYFKQINSTLHTYERKGAAPAIRIPATMKATPQGPERVPPQIFTWHEFISSESAAETAAEKAKAQKIAAQEAAVLAAAQAVLQTYAQPSVSATKITVRLYPKDEAKLAELVKLVVDLKLPYGLELAHSSMHKRERLVMSGFKDHGEAKGVLEQLYKKSKGIKKLIEMGLSEVHNDLKITSEMPKHLSLAAILGLIPPPPPKPKEDAEDAGDSYKKPEAPSEPDTHSAQITLTYSTENVHKLANARLKMIENDWQDSNGKLSIQTSMSNVTIRVEADTVLIAQSSISDILLDLAQIIPGWIKPTMSISVDDGDHTKTMGDFYGEVDLGPAPVPSAAGPGEGDVRLLLQAKPGYENIAKVVNALKDGATSQKFTWAPTLSLDPQGKPQGPQPGHFIVSFGKGEYAKLQKFVNKMSAEALDAISLTATGTFVVVTKGGKGYSHNILSVLNDKAIEKLADQYKLRDQDVLGVTVIFAVKENVQEVISALGGKLVTLGKSGKSGVSVEAASVEDAWEKIKTAATGSIATYIDWDPHGIKSIVKIAYKNKDGSDKGGPTRQIPIDLYAKLFTGKSLTEINPDLFKAAPPQKPIEVPADIPTADAMTEAEVKALLQAHKDDWGQCYVFTAQPEFIKMALPASKQITHVKTLDSGDNYLVLKAKYGGPISSLSVTKTLVDMALAIAAEVAVEADVFAYVPTNPDATGVERMLLFQSEVSGAHVFAIGKTSFKGSVDKIGAIKKLRELALGVEDNYSGKSEKDEDLIRVVVDIPPTDNHLAVYNDLVQSAKKHACTDYKMLKTAAGATVVVEGEFFFTTVEDAQAFETMVEAGDGPFKGLDLTVTGVNYQGTLYTSVQGLINDVSELPHKEGAGAGKKPQVKAKAGQMIPQTVADEQYAFVKEVADPSQYTVVFLASTNVTAQEAISYAQDSFVDIKQVSTQDSKWKGTMALIEFSSEDGAIKFINAIKSSTTGVYGTTHFLPMMPLWHKGDAVSIPGFSEPAKDPDVEKPAQHADPLGLSAEPGAIHLAEVPESYEKQLYKLMSTYGGKLSLQMSAGGKNVHIAMEFPHKELEDGNLRMYEFLARAVSQYIEPANVAYIHPHLGYNSYSEAPVYSDFQMKFWPIKLVLSMESLSVEQRAAVSDAVDKWMKDPGSPFLKQSTGGQFWLLGTYDENTPHYLRGFFEIVSGAVGIKDIKELEAFRIDAQNGEGNTLWVSSVGNWLDVLRIADPGVPKLILASGKASGKAPKEPPKAKKPVPQPEKAKAKNLKEPVSVLFYRSDATPAEDFKNVADKLNDLITLLQPHSFIESNVDDAYAIFIATFSTLEGAADFATIADSPTWKPAIKTTRFKYKGVTYSSVEKLKLAIQESLSRTIDSLDEAITSIFWPWPNPYRSNPLPLLQEHNHVV